MVNVNPYFVKENKKLSHEAIQLKLKNRLDVISESRFCRNFDQPAYETRCTCLHQFWEGNAGNEDQRSKLLKLMSQYAGHNEDARQLVLHGLITNGFVRKKQCRRGMRSGPHYPLPGISNLEMDDIMLVCGNAIRWIFHVGRKKWLRLEKQASLPAPNEFKNIMLSGNDRARTSCGDTILEFLDNVGDLEGEPYATRFIRTLVGIELRDEEKGIIELPPSYTKRKMYERFCYENGWVAKADARGNYKEWKNYELRCNDDHLGDLSEWPSSSVPQVICSWSTFTSYWAKFRPKLRIRPPSRDTCLQCNIFRNRVKYVQKNEIDPALENTADLDDDTLKCHIAEEREEQLILGAAKHVKMAIAQKTLASEKIKAAVESESNNHRFRNKVATIVMDYCQNLDLPHVGEEQVGETYFYSPINIYCLGIVNAATNQLYAYVYSEADGKKGGNNSSSILLHYLQNNILDCRRDRRNCPTPIQELNVIMDNCGGQNKNRMIIRTAAYIVEKGWAESVNLIFLIKGHTKNACDRNFNLLKKEWRHKNIYTMEQTFDVLNACENVHAIDASGLFYDWDSLYDGFYKKPESGSVNKNHIFSFTISNIDKRCIMTSKEAANSEDTHQQNLFYLQRNLKLCYRKLRLLFKNPKYIKPPGLSAIKQVDLFIKWRPIVPFQYKDITCPEPSDEVKLAAKSIKNKNRKQKNDYIRSNEDSTTIQSPARKRGRPRRTAPDTSSSKNKSSSTSNTKSKTPKRNRAVTVTLQKKHKLKKKTVQQRIEESSSDEDNRGNNDVEPPKHHAPSEQSNEADADGKIDTNTNKSEAYEGSTVLEPSVTTEYHEQGTVIAEVAADDEEIEVDLEIDTAPVQEIITTNNNETTNPVLPLTPSPRGKSMAKLEKMKSKRKPRKILRPKPKPKPPPPQPILVKHGRSTRSVTKQNLPAAKRTRTRSSKNKTVNYKT